MLCIVTDQSFGAAMYDLTAGEATNYGIGWRSGEDEQGRYFVGHGGGSVGGTTSMWIYPQHQLVVVVISNTTDADLGALVNSVAETFMREL